MQKHTPAALILLSLVILPMSVAASDRQRAEAILPMKVSLIQCGHAWELEKSCKAKEACCSLMDKLPTSEKVAFQTSGEDYQSFMVDDSPATNSSHLVLE